MCISVLPVCVFVHYIHAWSLKSKEGIGVSVTGVTDNCELPSGCWELMPLDPLKGIVLISSMST